MRVRLALLATAALLACPGPADAVYSALDGGSVAGVLFEDVNADGAGPQVGETGLSGWLAWAAVDGDGARGSTEPSATAAVDGAYVIAPLPPGDYTVRIEPPSGGCPPAAVCSRAVTVAAGGQSRLDFPVVTAGQDPGPILIDDEPVRIGLVRLSLPRRCARRPFDAVLTGSGVERVDFRVDRRRLRSVRRAGRDGRFALRIDPVKFKRGRHTVTAHVFFSTSATRAGKLVIGTFRSCRRR